MDEITFVVEKQKLKNWIHCTTHLYSFFDFTSHSSLLQHSDSVGKSTELFSLELMQCFVAWCENAPSSSTNAIDMLSDKTILWNWYNWQITSFYPITNQGRILASSILVETGYFLVSYFSDGFLILLSMMRTTLKQIETFHWWYCQVCGIKLGSWTVVECLVVLDWLKVQKQFTDCIHFILVLFPLSHFLIPW